MRKITCILLFICVTLQLSAQYSKLNFELARKYASGTTQPVSVLVKGNIATIRSLTVQAQGKFRYFSGDIASIVIPANKLALFMSNPEIKKLEARSHSVKAMNDSMLVVNNVTGVHDGNSPLPQGYDGDGIVMGVIDAGIDVTHPDFQDTLGKTRIKWLWDQKLADSANTPQPYGYGQEWSAAQIDSGLATAHNGGYEYGHGNYVAGIAAGNGNAILRDTALYDSLIQNNIVAPDFRRFMGVAPKADIVFVAFDFPGNHMDAMVDAVDYIFKKADALGKPCVINASLGEYYGSHDGEDLQAQLIKNMLNAQPGRVIVAAAGNAGGYAFHVQTEVANNDSAFTWASNGNGVFFELWGDSLNMKNLSFSVGADIFVANTSHNFRGRSKNYQTIYSNFQTLAYDTIYNANGDRIATVLSYSDVQGGAYFMQYLITPDSTSYYYRIQAKGDGKFDSWNFDYVSGNLPPSGTNPEMNKYSLPNITQTMVSSYQCLDDVITVANFVNKKQWYDVTNTLQVDNAVTSGDIASNSSVGPTRDGRIKPDIAASGANIFSCVVMAERANYIANYPGEMAIGGYHTRGGGTSASSPVVAGVAALYLQKNPNSTAMDVKNAIISCPKQDAFTGSNLPNNVWGYGKVDAFEAVRGCTTEKLATSKVTNSNIHIYPNPSNGKVNLEYTNVNGNAELVLLDILGKVVFTRSISSISGTLVINTSGFDSGIYFCQLISGGKTIEVSKLIIQ